MQLAMVEDRVVPYEELAPVYLDRGTFFGDGVYEVVRSYEGRIFALEEHLARFGRSLREVRIEGVDIADVRERVTMTFNRASIANAKIYFHVTRGAGDRSHTVAADTRPRFFLTVTELAEKPANKERGVAVSTFPDWRWKRCDIKSLNLLANVMAKMDADRKGCAEAILVNEAGEVTEGSSSAIFLVRAGGSEIVTRPLGPDILPSITRAVVERLAERAGVRVVEEVYRPADAARAEEVFLAVTTQDIVPVAAFDGVQIGEGRPGACTRKLIEVFREYVREGE
ncbi:MAG TPA: aminotransferase class IV [Anaerohalosphaeraceae bacterium]|jgi:D-alanine transaminase|nr:aminotransferase class IV [Anaerohalosphaeraceae bacterium]HRT50336.1 aminotransferase class IV [Anaerohalosphaeraceae bacterium]HRT86266.1 aminotransferase class IV [Anaerohalosphaeraceae bacterium]